MSTQPQPSTQWRERMDADEAQRHTLQAQQFAQLQAERNARFGPGRALHRKQVLGVAATLEVPGGLPDHARHGLFAYPARLDAWVRLSNGGADKASDRKPDVRGFAIQARGVQGPSALGQGATTVQSFLLINQPAFAFPRSDEFVDLVMQSVRGPGALIRYLFKRYGWWGGLKKIRRFAKTFGKPFTGFATETFYSAAPIACGPYAARVRLVPTGQQAFTKGKPGKKDKVDWAADFKRHVSQGVLRFDLQLQFFVDEARTPIEDASVDWPETVAPYVTVAHLTVPMQSPDSTSGQVLSDEIEAAAIDPWAALMAHRPLGEVMRARKVVYYQSQLGRRAPGGTQAPQAVSRAG
ncbi:MAG: catalase [Burkholderiales bacterium]|nr:catalase [Burkholderiales bacterium]